ADVRRRTVARFGEKSASSRRRLPFHRGLKQLFFRCASALPRPAPAHGESAPPVRFVLWQQTAHRSRPRGTLVSVRSRGITAAAIVRPALPPVRHPAPPDRRTRESCL